MSYKKNASYIFKTLREKITKGEYVFNERLPSERMLAEEHGVARGTIRAALDQLERAHLVQKRFSSGTFISYDTKFGDTNIVEDTSPLELIEARLAIEPHIVRLVISNASNKDLKNLREALENVKSCTNNIDNFSAADEAFHLSLVRCSQNPLLIWMYGRINDIRSHEQWEYLKNRILMKEKILCYNEQHSVLFNYIIQRDVENAVQTTIDHLLQAKTDLLGKLKTKYT